ncbi:MAG: MFS transporter [Nocardiaceae bacterium]|nr:MFS transporter [Nocardiaceae bacterium]
MTTAVVTEPEYEHRSPREIITVMSGLVITMLLAMLDNTIVGPALPTIVGELGGLQHLSWVLTAYTLTMAISTLVWGKLGDLYGRKPVFMTSIVVFLVGSALTGMAQSMFELTLFRALQGLGAGGLVVGVMSIVGVLVPPAERGKYQGLFMAVMPLAMLGGPLVGGWITDNASWRWAFYVNLPLGAIALATVWFTLNIKHHHYGKVIIDWTGAALLTVWVTALVLATSWGGSQYAWTSWQILTLGAVALVGLGVFIAYERKVDEPILPLHLFKNRNFALAGGLTFVVGLAMMGGAGYLPQYQQLVQHQTATQSGLLLLPMMLPMMVTSMLSGQITSRLGHVKILPIIGGLALTAGMLLLANIDVHTSKTTVALFMAVMGVGTGFMMQPSMLIAQNSITLRDMGSGMGANTFLRTMGMTVGVAALGTMYSSRLTTSLAEANPQAAAKLHGGAQMAPAMVEKMPQAVQDAIAAAVTHGIQGVFWVAAGFAFVGFIIALFVHEVHLRGRTGEAPSGPKHAMPKQSKHAAKQQVAVSV